MQRLVVVIAVAACAPPAAEPLPVVAFARAETTSPPPPLPRYHGAEPLGSCAVAIRPTTRAEREARTAAMLARLPAGSQLGLTDLGVYPDHIILPRGPGPVRTRAQALRVAKQFVHQTADVWGIGPHIGGAAVEKSDWIPARRTFPQGQLWAVELEVVAADPAPAGRTRGRIAMLIDRATGRIAARYARVPLPPLDLCPLPAAAPDDRFAAAVRAVETSATVQLDKPTYEYIVDTTADGDDLVRLVVMVIATPSPNASYFESTVFLLDPTTARVLAAQHPVERLDDWLMPWADTSALMPLLVPDSGSGADE